MIVALIFVLIFSTMAVSMAAMSGSGLQLADNHRKANFAFSNAESGLESMRYWLNRTTMSSTVAPSDYFSTIIAALHDDLAANNITNIVVYNDGAVPPVMLKTPVGHFFTARMRMDPDDPYVLMTYATGYASPITRTIRADFRISPYRFPIFDYGIATKGPLQFPMNPTFVGVNNLEEAEIYVESNNAVLAVSVGGNINFDGDIDIGNPLGYLDFGGDVAIGGDHGQVAIDNHVNIGAEPVEFPTPDAEHFRQYATGPVIDSSTDLGSAMTLSNALIAAEVNPTFASNVTIKGILFIEAPNQVVFNGNVSVEGIIVGAGDVYNAGTNKITFNGNFASTGYPDGQEYDAIRSETGSSIIAPGFAVEMAGNFSSVAGVMAVSGFYLSGNADALIEGTIINYSDQPTVIEGNPTLRFDRSGDVEIPAGFDTRRVLEYDASSYSVIH